MVSYALRSKAVLRMSAQSKAIELTFQGRIFSNGFSILSVLCNALADAGLLCSKMIHENQANVCHISALFTLETPSKAVFDQY